MKTVVITGSARGLGLEMAKVFRKNDLNVVISDLFKRDLDNAKRELLKVKGMVVLSGYDNDIYNRLLDNGWHKVLLGEYAKRGQKTNEGELSKGEEFVWVNYEIDNK